MQFLSNRPEAGPVHCGLAAGRAARISSVLLSPLFSNEGSSLRLAEAAFDSLPAGFDVLQPRIAAS